MHKTVLINNSAIIITRYKKNYYSLTKFFFSEKVGKSGKKWVKMNFRGRTQRSLDPKGRFMLSPEYRESLFLRMQKSENPLSEPHPSLLTQEHNTIISSPSDSLSEKKAEAEIKLVITTYDSCLVAYPWPDWLKLEEQFTKIANPSSKVRAFRRLFIGGAEEQTLDAQGRIRLSQEHREYAHLDKEITILGLTNRFEIWNPVLLKQSMEEIDFNAVSDELGESGIDFAL